jgi:hypothetical protein
VARRHNPSLQVENQVLNGGLNGKIIELYK